MRIGILKPSSKIIDTEKVFMSVAKCHGHESFVFTAKDIDFENRTIQGITLEKGKLISQTFAFPDLVQNRLPLNKEDAEKYVRLSHIAPFTTHHIGNKLDVYHKMKQHPILNQYVIENHHVKNFPEFLTLIDYYQYIILKPQSSNQGKGIFTLQKLDTSFHLKQKSVQKHLDLAQLELFFEEEVLNKNLLLNPFFVSQTQKQLSTVFRLHMILGENGEYQKIKFFPYVNLFEDENITNGMQGALITTREELFLEQHYPDAKQIIIKNIDQLFEDLKKFLNNLYDWPLDAVGVDIGINQQGELKIFELNAGPGVGFMAYPVAEQQILYYEWIHANQFRPQKDNFLPKYLRHLYTERS